MTAEVIAAQHDGALPPGDAGGEGVVDIVEGPLGGGVAGAPQAVEDAARLGLLLGFITEEGVLQGGGGVGGIQAQGLTKLVAGQGGLADLEEGVGEVLADIGAGWGGLNGGEKGGHGDIVIARAQGGIGAVGIARLGGRQHCRNGEEDGDAHITLEIECSGAGDVLREMWGWLNH